MEKRRYHVRELVVSHFVTGFRIVIVVFYAIVNHSKTSLGLGIYFFISRLCKFLIFLNELQHEQSKN